MLIYMYLQLAILNLKGSCTPFEFSHLEGSDEAIHTQLEKNQLIIIQIVNKYLGVFEWKCVNI